MAPMSRYIRWTLTLIAIACMSSAVTGCSKDSSKGTPISDRGAGGNDQGGGGDTDGGDRGADSGGGEKATPKAPSDLHARGADSGATGVQVSQNGIPAGAVREELLQQSASETEIRTTRVMDLGVSANESLVSRDVPLAGELSIDHVNSSAVGDHLQWLQVAVPDYANTYVRANHREYPPITTVGTDPNHEFDFTDYADDLLLNTALRLSMKTSSGGGYSDIQAGDNDFLPQEFFDDSRSFAADIKDIRSEITPHRSGGRAYSFVSVKVTYEYEGNNRVLDLYGVVNQSTRQAVLRQRVSGGTTPDHHFQGYLTCMDIPGQGYDCTNSMLVIEQVKVGQICKRVFAVLRHMHVSMSIDRDEYRSYFTTANDQKREFLQYIGNTIVNHRYQDGYFVPEDGDDILLFGSNKRDARGNAIPVIPVPYMDRITTRTFAVAHGYGESELLMRESSYSTLHTDEMTNPSLKDYRKDVFRIVGPLAKPIPGNNVSALVEVDGFIQDQVENWVQPNNGELLMSRLVGATEVIGNDGRGTMEVRFHFGTESLMVSFQSKNIAVKDPRNIKLYPYQGKQAPENITPDMMPLPF